ncbi:MAG: T9SS type A sorting domain-containing protein [Ignavibacteriae bacterium]|nr:T9SS type A sorting domain-containing protein [Ignavibacteriota bacterium]
MNNHFILSIPIITFSSNQNIEIVHRFELPEGSVINDMWLWIGDSVMQAKMYDTWTATAIYDSIVTNKRDPALLKKKGNQYELHVYPLESGSYGKVKINMITPVKWIGENAIAELPIRMLNANNLSKKPLEILFREKLDVWGEPKIYELPQQEFTHLIDTAGYNYKITNIEDISELNSLKISYSTTFNEGKFITGNEDKSGKSYFQLGILPGDLFDLTTDTTPKKNLYAIDLSGNKSKNLDYLLPNIENVMNSGMKDGYEFEVLVSGAGKINQLTNEMMNYSSQNVDTVLNKFFQSTFADSITFNTKPNIIFADWDAKNSWNFKGIEEYGDVKYFDYITDAISSFSNAQVIAAYRYGFDDPINQEQLNAMLTPLDSFFVKGGRLVTYFDYNRNDGELLARHYIPSLSSNHFQATAQTIYRNDDGNIGKSFPEEFDHNFVGILSYNDPDVKIEVMTANGDPVIISKKIRNGLLVVIDIWQIKDDGAMKSIVSPPLLGLNKTSSNLLLPELLQYISQLQNSSSFDNCILFSNSDSIITENTATSFVSEYLFSFSNVPKFNTINLLDGSDINPPSISVNNELFYGSGYLLNLLSSNTGGLHFETYKNDWDYITSLSNYASNPLIRNLDMQIIVDDGSSDIIASREVNPIKNDPNKPLFFIGETDGQNKINFNITATFYGLQNPVEKNIEFLFPHDTTKYETLIPSLLANEQLNDLFNESILDTAKIVNLAIAHNLLTDFTALLALEPNDTIHFLRNPYDESNLTVVEENKDEISDSSRIDIYPNPFNSQVQIKLYVKNTSKLNLTIYNILGQKIISIVNNEIIDDSYSYTWYGQNSFGSSVSTGLYLLRAEVTETDSNKKEIITKKLLYLK